MSQELHFVFYNRRKRRKKKNVTSPLFLTYSSPRSACWESNFRLSYSIAPPFRTNDYIIQGGCIVLAPIQWWINLMRNPVTKIHNPCRRTKRMYFSSMLCDVTKFLHKFFIFQHTRSHARFIRYEILYKRRRCPTIRELMCFVKSIKNAVKKIYKS